MARSVSSSTSALFTSALAYDLPANWTLLVRVKNMASSASHQILLGRRGTDGNGWAFGRTSVNEFGLWLFNAETIVAGSAAFPTDANWHAYAVTKSSSSSASFYRDTTTAIASSGAANCAASSDTTRGIFVGAMNDAGSGAFNSTAELAEIAIFSRVLNSTELGQWMSGDSPSLYATGLVHYWKLDAASGNESATVGGYNLTQVGTVGSTTHPTMNYGSTSTPTTISATLSNITGSVASKSSPKTTIAATLSNVTASVGHTTGTLKTTIAATLGNVVGAITSVGSTTNGTFTSEVLKDYAGNVLANTALNFVRFYNDTTGALVLNKTGVTTNGSGIVTFSDASLAAGMTYRVDWETAAGSRRMPRKAAT